MVHMKGNGSGFPAADYGEAVFSGEESFVFQKFYQFLSFHFPTSTR